MLGGGVSGMEGSGVGVGGAVGTGVGLGGTDVVAEITFEKGPSHSVFTPRTWYE